MAVENATTIGQLDPSLPLLNDLVSEGDDHIRLLKGVLQQDAASLSDTGTQAFSGPVSFPQGVSITGNLGVTGNLNLTGVQTISNNVPELRFAEVDQTDPAGRFRFLGDGNAFSLQRALTGNWATSENIWGFASNTLLVGKDTVFGAGLRLESATPQLRYYESDQTAPAGEYRDVVSNDIFSFQRALTASFATVTTIWRYTGSSGVFEIMAPLTLSGEMMFTGSPLTIYNDDPVLRFRDYNAGATAGQFAIRVNGNDFDFLSFDAANFGSTHVLWRYDNTADLFSFFVPVAPFTIAGSSPTLTFDETDLASPAGHWRFRGAANAFIFERAGTGNFATVSPLWTASTGLLDVQAALDVTGGALKVVGPGPQIRLEEDDQVAPAGRYRLLVTDDNFIIQRSASGDYTTVASVFGFVGSTGQAITYNQTRLASQAGDVEIGNGAGSTLKFNRTAGPAAIIVQSDASLRVQNAASTTWATISNGSGWVAGSDARLKENVVDIPYGLEAVLALRPVAFDWIADGVHDIGLVAQEVQAVVPEVVAVMGADEGEEEMLGLRKDALVAVLVRAVQELAARVEALEGSPA